MQVFPMILCNAQTSEDKLPSVWDFGHEYHSALWFWRLLSFPWLCCPICLSLWEQRWKEEQQATCRLDQVFLQMVPSRWLSVPWVGGLIVSTEAYSGVGEGWSATQRIMNSVQHIIQLLVLLYLIVPAAQRMTILGKASALQNGALPIQTEPE